MLTGLVFGLVDFPFPCNLLAVYWLSKPTLAPSVTNLISTWDADEGMVLRALAWDAVDPRTSRAST